MSKLLSRRGLITTGLAAAGASGLAVAARLADRYGLIPPDHGGIYGVGETLTYAAQRVLMANHSLAREFDRSQITKFVPIDGKPPEQENYQRLLAGGFADWRLQGGWPGGAAGSSFSGRAEELSLPHADHASGL